jgi:hypothetical protein
MSYRSKIDTQPQTGIGASSGSYLIVQLGIVSPKMERNTSWAAATLPLVNAL